MQVLSTKQYFRESFYEALDLVLESIATKFDQVTLDHLQNIEKLILSASNGEYDVASPAELEALFPLLKGDIDFHKLYNELALIPTTLKEILPHVKKVTLMSTVTEFMNKAGMKIVFSQLHKLIKLYYTVPMSNASSERAFSVLRRVKNYLRSRMTQKHTNHFVMLHAHRRLTDALDLSAIAKHFIGVNERRANYFGV